MNVTAISAEIVASLRLSDFALKDPRYRSTEKMITFHRSICYHFIGESRALLPFPRSLPMTAQNNLEQYGNFTAHPFAELLVEIAQAKFSGSLRVSHETQKAIIYFRKG